MLQRIARRTKAEYIQYRSAPIKVVRLRPLMIEKFLLECHDPLDTLVFLDVDHGHQANIVNQLVARDDLPIHSSLTFKRAPTLPVALAMDYPQGFKRNEVAVHVSGFEEGDILECDRGGFAAVAIQRKVFMGILELGYDTKEFFMYKGQRDCDQWFAQLTHEAGFKHFVNTSIVSPHNTDTRSAVGLENWDRYVKGKGDPGVIRQQD